MKKLFIITGILTLFAFLLPFLSIRGSPLLFESGISRLPLSEDAVLAGAFSGNPPPSPSSGDTNLMDTSVTVKVLLGESVISLPMDEYLLGVTAAEMPAVFPDEALRAQAIAARTFTLNRMRIAGSAPFDEHLGAHVCANPSHCKAYTPVSELEEKWGASAPMYIEKIKSAVTSTDGLVALYESEPILAVFHAASSGRTERAADVWERDVPYLQSVESPGETESPRYYGRAEINASEFSGAFLETYPAADLSGSPESWFTDIARSEAGGVVTLGVGGVTVKGNVIRTMCGLLSTNFEIAFSGDLIIFKTVGYGHGVGMSQYGARALALEGKTAEEIIKWYYKGIELGHFYPEAA